MKGESIRHLFARFSSADGRLIWLESTIVPTLDAQGRLLRTDGGLRDVHRKPTGRGPLSSVDRNLPQTWCWKPTRKGASNSSMEPSRLLGSKPSEAVGRPFVGFPPSGYTVEGPQRFQTPNGGNRLRQFEARFLHIDGSERSSAFRLKKEAEGASFPSGSRRRGATITVRKAIGRPDTTIQRVGRGGQTGPGYGARFQQPPHGHLSHARGLSRPFRIPIPPEKT